MAESKTDTKKTGKKVAKKRSSTETSDTVESNQADAVNTKTGGDTSQAEAVDTKTSSDTNQAKAVDTKTRGDTSQADAVNTTTGGDTSQAGTVNTKTSSETSQVKDRSEKARIVSWLALLLSGLALCVGIAVWYLTAVGNVGQQEARFNLITQRIDEFDAAQSNNNNALSQLQNQLVQTRAVQNEFIEQKSATQQAINAQADDYRQKIDTLADALAKLRAEQGRDTEARTLAQAERLILMANQRLQFGGQFAGGQILAKHALQDADALLHKLSDPTLNSVRQLLGMEMSALAKVTPVDTVGVLNTLSALSSGLENLALAGDIVVPEKPAQKSNVDASTDSKQPVSTQADTVSSLGRLDRYMQSIADAFASFLSSMSDLIQIEKNGKPVKPIMSAEVRQMTYQRARLMLDSAQIAFIRQQSELYRDRIQATHSWVQESFAQDTDETKRWLVRLDDVGLILPQSNLPDISESLKAIRNIIKNRRSESVSNSQHQAE